MQDPVSRHGSTIPIVNVDHGNAIGTTRKHGIQCYMTTFCYTVPHTGRHSDDRLGHQSANHCRQCALKTGNDDEYPEFFYFIQFAEQTVDA